MNKSAIYEQVIEFAKANNIKYAVTTNDEMCPEMDLNGYCFLDTESLEIPCSFSVDKALVLCINTPMDMTPEDTGKSYDKYWNVITNLNKIQKPQYVALDGAYVKLMCWCDWAGEEDNRCDFTEACQAAMMLIDAKYSGYYIDFRLFVDKDVTPFIFSVQEIFDMWEYVKNLVDWDIEIYASIPDKNTWKAVATDHGVESHNNSGLRIIKAY